MSASGTGALDTIRLPPEPASARAARQHVARVIETGPLSDLVETASLLVSEIVTNALLHAGTDIELSCSVEQGSLCVQVRDRSTVSPSPRHYAAGAMTGRGLGMVELLAAEWGVDVDEHGKTVWFRLAGPDADPVRHVAPAEPVMPVAHFDVRLLNLPPDLVMATVQYGDAVLREHALLTIGSAPGNGSASGWQTAWIDIGPVLRQAERAHEAGQASIDLVLSFPDGAGRGALERLALVDEADRLAQAGELLTPAALPEIDACRHWLYGQIGLQADGAPPRAWSMPEPLEPAWGPAKLPDDERRRLDALTQGAIVADDANRILYANSLAAHALGWKADEMAGRRLVSIVPPELRAAHLAGFSRYLLTGETRLIGQRVRLPAQHRDGSIVEIDVTIDVLDLSGGRRGFRAILG